MNAKINTTGFKSYGLKNIFYSLLIFSLILVLSEAASALSCNYGLDSNHTMTEDLTNCNGTGNYAFFLAKNDIVLDCNGHTISGNATWGVILSHNAADDRITVKNCNIEGFTIGIQLQEGSDHKILHNNISLTEQGISWVPDAGGNHNISYNNIYSNSWSGMYVRSGSNKNYIAYNNISSNTNYGIKLENSSNNTIKGNRINNTTNYEGIKLESSNYNNITDNTLTDSGQSGIWLNSSSNNNTLINNTANSNSDGIHLGSSSNNTLINNTANSNNNNGILLQYSSDNILEENEIKNNNIGIYSQKSNSTINSNIACNNADIDFYSSGWLSSSGDNNTCNNTDGWRDNGIENACTFRCNGTACDFDNDYYAKSICGGTDCNDNNNLTYPGAAEICDGIANDCTDQIDGGCDDDNDDYCDFSMMLVGTPAVCPNGGNDCNDTNNLTNPGASEIYNQIDDNCNNQIDEGFCDANDNCLDNQTCSPENHLCQDLNCSADHEVFNHRCYHKCDLNRNGIITQDYNDLMAACKCFLGIENCNNYYQDWNLMRKEYNCFVGQA